MIYLLNKMNLAGYEGAAEAIKQAKSPKQAIEIAFKICTSKEPDAWTSKDKIQKGNTK